MVKAQLYDVKYDTATQDLAVAGGDLDTFLSSYDDLLDQMLIDAFECSPNSMKSIIRQWGFEGRSDVFNTTDNRPRQKAKMYLTEMFNPLSFLIDDVYKLNSTFPGNNHAIFAIGVTLNDIAKTNWDKTLDWSGDTKRGVIS